MSFDSIIGRADANALIPVAIANEIIKSASEQSAALSLFRRARLSTKVTRQPVLASLRRRILSTATPA